MEKSVFKKMYFLLNLLKGRMRDTLRTYSVESAQAVIPQFFMIRAAVVVGQWRDLEPRK